MSQHLTLPRIYINESPRPYQDDQTGRLPNAVRTFFQQPRSVTRQQMVVLTDYCSYYINAPGWYTTGMENAFAALRREIAGIEEVNHLRDWLGRALELGIDPF